MPKGQHPTDDLIRQLIPARRVPTSPEITQILSHIATAVLAPWADLSVPKAGETDPISRPGLSARDALDRPG